ncbi:S-layer homology domain-containing protein [Desertibacillus haloalkaliphilus]|uniref:S-layer homology domain-containing protein n=1 Tax=Desertibacillus haloalkaliphilus TaxID=1328930 RepID=UPI001C262DAC|nr:S-layer homology domain-containing protein [Desertibacillus haloalkaliphilus]MBU8905936.1 S-layer homology domain-containing protein [Desertibacillus haloalkaliphilus]
MGYKYNPKSYRNFLASSVTMVSAVAVGASFVPSTENVEAATFSFLDVAEDAYYYEPITYLVNKGSVKGYNDQTFKPDDHVTRAEAAKMIADTIGLDTTGTTGSSFSDVEDDLWYTGAVSVMADLGVINGYPDHTFKPHEKVTRAEIAKMIVEAYQSIDKQEADNLFDDVKDDAWYKQYVGALVENNVTTGKSASTFAPDDFVTRGEAATFLYRSDQVPGSSSQITNIGEETLEVDGVTYQLSDEVKGIFNEENIDVLTGAYVDFEVEEKKITTLTYLELTNSGDFADDESSNQLVLEGNGSVIDGDVKVRADNISIENLEVSGDLEIAVEVTESFYANNLNVKGETLINDKDVAVASVSILNTNQNSVVFEDSHLNRVEVHKNDVEVEAKGSTTVQEINFSRNAAFTASEGVEVSILKLEDGAESVEVNATVQEVIVNSLNETSLSGDAHISNIKVDGEGAFTLSVSGQVGNVEISNEHAKVELADGVSIDNIATPEGAEVGDLVNDYDNVKGQIDSVNGEGSTAPRRGSGGSSSSSNSSSSEQDSNNDEPESPGDADVEVSVDTISNLEETVSVGEAFELPETVTAEMEDGSEADVEVLWGSGTAYTNDVGTFEYEGAVEDYEGKVKLTLHVVLDGYEEKENGSVAVVTNKAAATYAKDVITVQELEVTEDIQLPENLGLPVTIPEGVNGITVDLNGNELEEVTVQGENVTLKNGTIENIKLEEGIQNLTLEDIDDYARSEHLIDQAGIASVVLAGNTELQGDVLIKESVELTGEGNGEITGSVRVETPESVTLSAPIHSVVVEELNDSIYIREDIERIIVREDATIYLADGVEIDQPEKRTGVEVTVEDQGDAVAALQVVSILSSDDTLEFEEVVDTFDLDRYIGVAENFLEAADIGDQDGQFPEWVHEELQGKLAEAKENRENVIVEAEDVEAEQEKVDGFTINIRKALDDFSDERIFVDTASFRSHLRAMEQLLARTAIGDTYGHVPEDAYNEFEAAVERARNALASGLSKEDKPVEEEALHQAEEDFRDAYVELPFFSRDSYTVEGEMTFEVQGEGEEFTDFVEFKVYDHEYEGYETTGWSIWSDYEEDLWVGMTARRLNSGHINLFEAEQVYYTVATNQHIYTGTFTIDEFEEGKVIELVPEEVETGTLDIQVPFAGDNFELEGIVIENEDYSYSDSEWHHIYEVAESTEVPVGDYTIQVYGHDDDHEYILSQTGFGITEGLNTVTFNEDEVDQVTIEWEDFTGWQFEPSRYSASGSHTRYWRSFHDESRIPHPSIMVHKDYDFIEAEYYANHSERNEQWRYRVDMERDQKGQDEVIRTSPHFEFEINEFQNFEGYIIDNADAPFHHYFHIDLVNDFGHRLNDLYFFHDGTFLEYGGEVTVSDGENEGVKNLSYVWDFNQASIAEILPGVTGEVEITFSMGDLPFLIPDKTITVFVGEEGSSEWEGPSEENEANDPDIELIEKTALITDVRTSADGYIERIGAFIDGEEIRLSVDAGMEITNLSASDVVDLTLNENTDEVISVDLIDPELVLTEREVNPEEVSVVDRTFKTMDGDEYRLTDDTYIYFAAELEEVEITTLRDLRDLEADNEVTVVLAEEGSLYVEKVIVTRDGEESSDTSTTELTELVLNPEEVNVADQTFSTTDGVEYELVSEGEVYFDASVTSSGEEEQGRLRDLSDLEIDNEVTIVLVEEGSMYVEKVIVTRNEVIASVANNPYVDGASVTFKEDNDVKVTTSNEDEDYQTQTFTANATVVSEETYMVEGHEFAEYAGTVTLRQI